MAGNYYMYIESGSMGHLENARLVSNILQQGVLSINIVNVPNKWKSLNNAQFVISVFYILELE